MSDYLGNLAAKSLAPAPALQPRLASRFEPLAPAAPELRESTVFLEETVTESAAPPPAPIPTKTESRSPSPSGRGGVRPRRAERSEEHHAHEATAEKISEDSPEPRRKPEPVRRRVPAPVEAEPERVQSVVAQRSVQPFEASPPDPLSRGERGNLAAAAVAKPVLLQPLTVVQIPPRQDAAVTSLLSPRERATGGEGPREFRTEKPQHQESPVPRLQPRVTLAERQPFAPLREAPAPEPVIHVTIGRIEVRATAAPKAPARERPAARPAVDLDEYLRQRSKGEGR
ncbi:MAG TPA: hypothetical protein VLB76_11575 [Thermoanaerobaculia bacterium]|jgi:hypothetical protein|nr:hypothetical protein [Thermoanaerobaculia bacterium]